MSLLCSQRSVGMAAGRSCLHCARASVAAFALQTADLLAPQITGGVRLAWWARKGLLAWRRPAERSARAPVTLQMLITPPVCLHKKTHEPRCPCLRARSFNRVNDVHALSPHW